MTVQMDIFSFTFKPIPLFPSFTTILTSLFKKEQTFSKSHLSRLKEKWEIKLKGEMKKSVNRLLFDSSFNVPGIVDVVVVSRGREEEEGE